MGVFVPALIFGRKLAQMYPAIASKDSLKLVNGWGWLLLRENITIEDTGLHSGIQMGNITTEDIGLHRGLHRGLN